MTVDCTIPSALPLSNQELSAATRDTVSDTLAHTQSQRLVHLRHASSCKCNDTVCEASEFCGRLKKLWPHLLRCKNGGCKVPLCASSRSVLIHYRECKDVSCRICQPARIKRSAEDEKMVLDQYKLQAPPTKRVRQSASRTSLVLLGTSNDGNSSDTCSSDSERDSSCSYTYSSSSCEECKDPEDHSEQKAPEMVKIIHHLARVVISTPETF